MTTESGFIRLRKLQQVKSRKRITSRYYSLNTNDSPIQDKNHTQSKINSLMIAIVLAEMSFRRSQYDEEFSKSFLLCVRKNPKQTAQKSH